MNDQDKAALGKDPLAWVFEEDQEDQQDQADANAQPNDTAADSLQLRLEPVQDISSVADFAERARSALGRPRVAIAADAAARVDTALLQVLFALKRDLEQQDGELVWLEPSEPLRRAAHYLGLQHALALPA